jgi:MFS family permease
MVSVSFRVRGFRPLAVSYAINELGDNLGVIALALLVLDRTGSVAATTALFLIGKFAPALLAPILTAALDRTAVARSLPLLYAVEGAAFAGLALLAGSFWLPGVLALAFLDGLLAITARGLSRAAIAAVLAPAGALREGNAVINVLFAVTGVGGPLLAGLLVHAFGAGTALAADAVSFVIAAALLAVFSRELPPPRVDAGHESWMGRVRAGLDYLRGHPVAGRLVAGEAIAIIFFTITVPIEVVYVKTSLDSTSVGFGLLVASWGAGILLGSAIFARGGSWSIATMVLLSTAAVGGGYAVMAVAPTLLVACAGSVLGGTGNGVQWVAVMTALQEAIAEEYQARVVGLLESIAAAAPGVGFVLGGVLTDLVDARVAYAVAAGGVALVCVAWARRPIVPQRAAV